MMTLSTLLHSTSLAEAFLNTAIHSVVFSIIVVLACLFLRRASPYVASAGLFTVLVFLTILPLIEFGPHANLGTWWAVEVTETAIATIPSTDAPPPTPIDQTLAPSQKRARSWIPYPWTPTTLTNGFGLIWIVGIIVLAGRFFRSLWQLHRIKRRLKPVLQTGPAELWQSMRQQQTVNPKITFSQLDEPCSPFAFGYFRPHIVLPTDLIESGSDQEISDALLHELNHIMSRDLWFSILQRIVVTLYWWNPLISWLEQQFHLSREKLCDMAVINHTGNAKAYATTLVAMANRLNTFMSLPAPSRRMASSFSLLEERIKNIATNQKTMKSTRIKSLAWTACFTAVSAGLLTLGVKATWAGKEETIATLKSSGNDTLQLSVDKNTVELSVIGPDGQTRTVELPIGDKAKAAELQQLIGRLQQPEPSPMERKHSRFEVPGLAPAKLNEPVASDLFSSQTTSSLGASAPAKPALPATSAGSIFNTASSDVAAAPTAPTIRPETAPSLPRQRSRMSTSTRANSVKNSNWNPRYSMGSSPQPTPGIAGSARPLPAPKPKRIRPSLSTNTDTQAIIPQPLTVPTEPEASALARPMLEVVAPVKPQIAAIPSAADLPKAPSSAEVLRALEQLEARMQALEERQARANKNAARQYKSKSASDFSY